MNDVASENSAVLARQSSVTSLDHRAFSPTLSNMSDDDDRAFDDIILAFEQTNQQFSMITEPAHIPDQLPEQHAQFIGQPAHIPDQFRQFPQHPEQHAQFIGELAQFIGQLPQFPDQHNELSVQSSRVCLQFTLHLLSLDNYVAVF